MKAFGALLSFLVLVGPSAWLQGGCAAPAEAPALQADIAAAEAADDPVVAVESEAPRRPSADLDQDGGPIKPMAQFVSGKAARPLDGLPTDGQFVTLSGRLAAGDEGLCPEFLCDNPAVTVKLRLLPNGYLQRMQEIAAAEDASPQFELTGEITRYKKSVYMLVTRSVVLEAATAAPADNAR